MVGFDSPIPVKGGTVAANRNFQASYEELLKKGRKEEEKKKNCWPIILSFDKNIQKLRVYNPALVLPVTRAIYGFQSSGV